MSDTLTKDCPAERRGELLLTDAIVHHARLSGDETMLVCGSDRLTWRTFEQQSRKLANALIERGLTKGAKVGIYMANSAPGFVAMWAIMRAGGVVSALNTLLQGEALAGTIDNSDAMFVFTDAPLQAECAAAWAKVARHPADHVIATGGGPGSLEAMIEGGSEEPVPIILSDDDSASIVYSSGSTGKPKGVEHSHGARRSFSLGLGGVIGIVDHHAVTLISTPLCTNGTWITMAPTILRGGRIVLMPKFNAELLLDLVERERCTHGFMVPTQLTAITAAQRERPRDLSSLRGVLSAGQPLAAPLYEALCKLVPSARIYEAYGMSEGFGTIATPDDFARGKRGSVGKPWYLDDIAILGPDGREVARGEIGEIAGWSAGMMKGYYRDPERTAEAIWRDGGRTLLRSGDLGFLDEDGYLFISGRIKDMIKSGGLNVFASDIESAFVHHPQVREAAAIGVPHPKWGETPLLLVIREPGASIGEAELMAWGNERLAKFQRISALEFRDDFARAQYGKVDKNALRAPYWGAVDASPRGPSAR